MSYTVKDFLLMGWETTGIIKQWSFGKEAIKGHFLFTETWSIILSLKYLFENKIFAMIQGH